MSVAVANVDIDALKQRLRATWMAGDYDRFSRFMESSAVEFLDRVPIPPGASLLDVACAQSKLANRTAVDAEYLQVVAIRSKQ